MRLCTQGIRGLVGAGNGRWWKEEREYRCESSNGQHPVTVASNFRDMPHNQYQMWMCCPSLSQGISEATYSGFLRFR